MIYELRTFQALPGKLPIVHKHVAEHTVPLLEKNGVKVIACWTWLFGGSSEQMVMLLAHESLEARDRTWTAFQQDPEWLQFRKEAEHVDGRVLDHSTAQLMQPTPYSPLR